MNFVNYIKSLLLGLLLLYIALLLYFRIGIVKITAITAFLVALFFLIKPYQIAPRYQKIAYTATIWLFPMVGVPMGLGAAIAQSPFVAFLWGYLLIAILGYLDAPISLLYLQIIATILMVIKTPRQLPASIWAVALANLLLAYDVWPQFIKQGVDITWYVYFAYEAPQTTHLAYQLFLRYFTLEIGRLDTAMWAYQLSLLIPIAVYEVFEKNNKAQWATALFTFTYATLSLPIALVATTSVGTDNALIMAKTLQSMAQFAWFFVYAKTIATLATIRLVYINEPASVLAATASHIISIAYLPTAAILRVLLGGPPLDRKTVISTISVVPLTYLMTGSTIFTAAGALISIIYWILYIFNEKLNRLVKIIEIIPDFRLFIIIIIATASIAYLINPWQYLDLFYRVWQAGEYPILMSFIIPVGLVGVLAVLRSSKKEQAAMLIIVLGSYALFLSGYFIGAAAGGLRLVPLLMYLAVSISTREYNTAVLILLLLFSFGNAVIYVDGWYVDGFKIPAISSKCHHICVTDSWEGRSQLLISNGIPVKNINLFTAQYPLGPLWVLKTYGNETLQTFPFSKGDGYLYTTPPENLSTTPPPAISAETAVLGDEVHLIRGLYNAGIPVAVVAPADIYAKAGALVLGNSSIQTVQECPAQVELPHSLWTYINITLTGVGEIRMWEGAIQVGKDVTFGNYKTPRINTTQILYTNKSWFLNGQPLNLADKPYYFLIRCINGSVDIKATRILPAPGPGEIRYFPLEKPPRFKISSTFEDYRQPKVIELLEAENVQIVASSGVLEEVDGITVVEPLANVYIKAEKIKINGGSYTYPRVTIENGIINGRRVRTAYLLLRYPNITASKAYVLFEGVKYTGDNIECQYAMWDGSLYCYNLYFYKNGKVILKTNPIAVNPPAEELSLLSKAAPLLMAIIPLALILIFLNDLLTNRLEES